MNRKLLKQILMALAIIVTPNLVLLGLAHFVGVYRPWLNFDYAVAALLFVLLPFWLASLAFVLFFIFDLLAMLGQLLPFFRLQDLFYLSRFVTIAPGLYQLAVGLAVVVAFASLGLFRCLQRRLPREPVLIVVNLFVLAYLSAVFVFAPSHYDRIWRIADERPLASQTVFFINTRSEGFVESFFVEGSPLEPPRYEGLTEPLFQAPEKAGDRLLLIVAESWGVSSEPIMRDVLAPLMARRSQFEAFSRGALPFEGLTVAGEFRELCRYWPKHFNFRESGESLDDCLPNQLGELGYATRAMHGAVGTMYDRAYWYPKAGFDSTVFFETRPWKERCYSFPGACDFELMEELPRFFAEEEKGFFYWLTLNSHYIYDKRDIRIDVFDCEKHGLASESQICRNLKLHAQFFHYLGETIDDPEMQDVTIFVIGDHDPVIGDREKQKVHFERYRVPWLRVET